MIAIWLSKGRLPACHFILAMEQARRRAVPGTTSAYLSLTADARKLTAVF